MINSIYSDDKVFPIIAQSLEEEGISVDFGDSLLTGSGEIDHNKVVILKPDLHYNTSHMKNPPPSVDGVVIVQDNDGHHFYVAELKSSRLSALKKREIQAKFDTIFNTFFKIDFYHIFEEPAYSIKKMNLWLVCDPFQTKKKCKSQEEYAKKILALERLRGSLADFASSFRPHTFRGHTEIITPMLTPPIIEQSGYIDFIDSANQNFAPPQSFSAHRVDNGVVLPTDTDGGELA